MFNVSLEEKGHPTGNIKKLISSLKKKYKCVLNKDNLQIKKIKNAKAMVFMGPTKELSQENIQTLHDYVSQGGYVILMSESGGDAKYGFLFF